MNEYLVTQHLSDLRHDAEAHRRAASRADKAQPRLRTRATTLLHRRPAAIGCDA